jgi:hypothetical protein
LASKSVATVSWLSLKTKVVEGFPVWTLKLQLRFGDSGLKITAMVSWFGPQNHRDSFLVWDSKPSGFVAPQN